MDNLSIESERGRLMLRLLAASAERDPKPICLPDPPWRGGGGGVVEIAPHTPCERTRRHFAAPEYPPGAQPGALEMGAIVEARDLTGAARRIEVRPVWRRRRGDLMRHMRADHRQALEDYAHCHEVISGSGGAPDASGVRSGRVSDGPSLGKLAAAERLARMERALSGAAMFVRTGAAACTQHRSAVSVPHVDLAYMVAVEGLQVSEIFKRIGFYEGQRHNEYARAYLRMVLADLAGRLVRLRK